MVINDHHWKRAASAETAVSEVLGRQVRETAMATPRCPGLILTVRLWQMNTLELDLLVRPLFSARTMRWGARKLTHTMVGIAWLAKLKGAKSDLNKATRLQGHRVLQQLNFQRPASSGELTSQAIEGLRKFDRYCDHCYHMVSDYLLHNLWQSCFSYPAFAALFKVESL